MAATPPPPAVAASDGSAVTAPPTGIQASQALPRCRTHREPLVPTTATVRPPSAVKARAGAPRRRPPRLCQGPQAEPIRSRSQRAWSAPRRATTSLPPKAAAAGLLVPVPPTVSQVAAPLSVGVTQTALSVPRTAKTVLEEEAAAGPPSMRPPSEAVAVHEVPVPVSTRSDPSGPRTASWTPASVVVAAGAGYWLELPARSTKR